MYDTHIRLLRLLEIRGISGSTEINTFLQNHFDKPDNTILINWGLDNDDAMRLIKSLQERNYAHFNWNLFEAPIYQGYETTQEYEWFDTYPLMASITLEGLDYLYQHTLSEVSIEASLATTRSFWTTLILSLLTFFLSAGGVVLTYLTFEETKENSASLASIEKRIDHLSLQSQQTELRILRQSDSIALHLGRFRKLEPSSSGSVRKTK